MQVQEAISRETDISSDDLARTAKLPHFVARSLALAIGLVAVLWPNAYGSPDMTKRDTLALDMSFQLSEKIRLSEPFDLTLNVTVRDSVPHDNDSLDEIDILLPDGCEVLSGKPFWQGKLYRGCSVAIKLRARIAEPLQGVFRGFVYSGYVPQHMNLYRTVNSLVSNEFSVISEVARDTTQTPADLTTSSTRKRCLVLPIDGPSGVSGDKARSEIPIEIVGGEIVGDDTFTLDRKALNSLSFWVKESPTATAVRTIPQRWQLSCPLYDMALNPDSTAILLIDRQIDTTTMSFEVEGTRYQVRLKVVPNNGSSRIQ